MHTLALFLLRSACVCVCVRQFRQTEYAQKGEKVKNTGQNHGLKRKSNKTWKCAFIFCTPYIVRHPNFQGPTETELHVWTTKATLRQHDKAPLLKLFFILFYEHRLCYFGFFWLVWVFCAWIRACMNLKCAQRRIRELTLWSQCMMQCMVSRCKQALESLTWGVPFFFSIQCLEAKRVWGTWLL